MAAKQQTPTDESLVSTPQAFSVKKKKVSKVSSPDKIVVDLLTQHNVIVDMVDPDFFSRKRNGRGHTTESCMTFKLVEDA